MCKKILIAEDFEDNRQLMRFFLESWGYEVLEAEDGKAAVAAVVNDHPDLVLMDVSMPVMDGLTATRIIRESVPKENLPIIAVTAYGDFCYKNAIEAGCDKVVNKPLDFDSFQPVIMQYIG